MDSISTAEQLDFLTPRELDTPQEVIELKIEDTSFTAQDIKRTRKQLKKQGIPKEYWFVEITDTETNTLYRFKL